MPSVLRSELQKTLPQYMLPSLIVCLDSLPLTANGKIDKKRLLLETREAVTDTDMAFVEPREGLESKLAQAAAEALGLERLGATTELRAAGMTSLKAVLLAQKLRELNLTLPLNQVYELQTVRAICEHLQQAPELGMVESRESGQGACTGGRCTHHAFYTCIIMYTSWSTLN